MFKQPGNLLILPCLWNSTLLYHGIFICKPIFIEITTRTIKLINRQRCYHNPRSNVIKTHISFSLCCMENTRMQGIVVKSCAVTDGRAAIGFSSHSFCTRRSEIFPFEKVAVPAPVQNMMYDPQDQHTCSKPFMDQVPGELPRH